MAKKAVLLMAILTAFAFAIPAFANAAPAVTSEKNVLAPAGPGETGSTLMLESTNVQWETALGIIGCEQFQMTAWLTQNNGAELEATHDEGATNQATGCRVGNIPLTVTDPTLTVLKANATAKTVSLDFTWPELGCTWSGTVPFSYTAGGSLIHIEGSLTANAKACGLSLFFKGDFAVAIGGTDVILD
jgi:hypothetical protein